MTPQETSLETKPFASFFLAARWGGHIHRCRVDPLRCDVIPLNTFDTQAWYGHILCSFLRLQRLKLVCNTHLVMFGIPTILGIQSFWAHEAFWGWPWGWDDRHDLCLLARLLHQLFLCRNGRCNRLWGGKGEVLPAGALLLSCFGCTEGVAILADMCKHDQTQISWFCCRFWQSNERWKATNKKSSILAAWKFWPQMTDTGTMLLWVCLQALKGKDRRGTCCLLDACRPWQLKVIINLFC